MLSKRFATTFLTSVVALSACDKTLFADDALDAPKKTTRSGKANDAASRSKAIDRYWKILTANPREGAAFDRVYYDYVGRGEGAALIAELETLANKAVGEEKGKRLYLLGLTLIRRSERERAVEILREAETLAPELAAISTTLGKTLAAQGRFQECCDALERALKKDLSDDARIEVLQKLGETYVRLEANEKADAVWEEALRRYSDRADALARIAEIQANVGRYRQAAQVFAQLEKSARERRDVESEIEFAVASGDMKIRLGEREAAIGDFERAVEKLAPSHWLFKSLRDRIEYVLLQRSDYDAALDYYRRIIEKSPTDLDASARLASLLAALGKYDEAETVLGDALKRAPKNVELRRTALELALAQERYDVADRRFGELDELNANDEDAYLLWGEVVMKNDSLDAETKRGRAIDIWSRVIDEKRQNVATALLIAEKIAQNNFRAESEKILVDLAVANPRDFEVCASLASFYLNDGKEAKAFAALDAFAKRNPKDVSACLRRADFLNSRGYLNEAIDAARRAVELSAENFEARLRVIELASDAGDFETVGAEIEATQKVAETEDEKNRLFAARMRYLEATDRVREYLDSLDLALRDKSASEQTIVENYWNKTSCLLASGDPNGAVETAIEALERGAFSATLTRKIPEIAAKSQAPERTLALLNVAADKDSANKATYLRGAANVRLELGMVDEAAQTARDLLALDPGNASNCRTCADVLWACGLVDETSDVLRKAVALDGEDKASQLKLASLLDETGATAEAIDVLTPIFDKATRLEEKLSLIDALTKYYVKIDAFETLKERLDSPAQTEKTRRENAYCLARAYMAVKAYDAARSTLENRLSFVKKSGENDVFLLNALSNLAELQNDLEGAIRYQKALCEIDDSYPESQRLLELYRRSDDKSRARRYLTQKILPREPLWRQLETVDVLASLRKYDEADEILREIERKFPKNWEVAARRVSLAGWAIDDKAGDAAPSIEPNDLNEAIKKLRSISENSTTQAAKTTELARNPETPATTISGDAWKLGDLAGRSVSALENSEDWRNFAAQILTTVYRERLTLSDKNVRSVYASISKPQTPTQGYLTFGGALFEASAWEMKKSPEKIVEIFRAETTEGAPNDLASLKQRFLFFVYATLARENIEEFKSLPKKELKNALEQTTLTLAELDAAWRVEAAPIALAKLAAEETSEQLAKNYAASLVAALEGSLNGGNFTKDKSLWRLGKEIANVLTKRDLNDEARRVEELIAVVGARDYSVFLNVETNGAYSSFESFATSIRNAEERVVKQVRNRADVERARQELGAAFAARLQIELREAFKNDSLGMSARITAASERWKELTQKTAFGASTLNIFAQLNRRELFEVETPLDNATRDAAKRFENAVYKTLELAFETDARLQKAFAEREGGTRIAADPLEESLRYLGRDPSSSVTLASFLVNRAVYGAGEGAGSLLESSALLEAAVGAFFALDVAESTQEASLKDFTRTENLRGFIAKNIEGDKTSLRRYSRQVLKAEACVRALAQNKTQPESLEELKAIALENLSTAEGEAKPEETRLLVALAILAQAEGDDAGALEYLRRVPTRNFVDSKALELAVLEAFAKTEFPEAIARKNEAINKLLGYRLDEKEAFRFYNLLQAENRLDDAEKIRRRLTLFASDYSVVKFLLDNMLELRREDSQFSDDEIGFAMRIFKTAGWNSGDANARAELRAKALAVLNAAGKLGETQESLRRFLTNAPGAVETTMRLVDVEIERGQVDSAKKFLAALEDRLPNEAGAFVDYATSLAKVGETEKAKTFLNKAFARKLDAYFSNADKPEFWTLSDDVAFLETQEVEALAPFAAASFRIALNATNDAALAEKGIALIDRLWNGAVSQEARIALQTSGLRLLATTNDARFFPYLRDWFCNAVAPNAEFNEPYPDYQDVCRVVFWSDNAPETLSIIALRLLNPEDDAETLETFLTKLEEFAKVYADRPDENPARQSGNFVLMISTLLRLGRVDEAAKIAQEAKQFEVFCAKGFKNDALSICLAFEYFVDAESREKHGELLLDLYERSWIENPHPVYEPFYISRIYPLGARSLNPTVKTKYVEKTFQKLREMFRLIADADFKSNRRISGTLETVDNFELYAQTLGESALAIGETKKLRQILEESEVADRFGDLDGATPEWTRCVDMIRNLSDQCAESSQQQ